MPTHTFVGGVAKRRTYRPVLVSLSCAATELGLEPESVTQMTEAGTLRFVFDIAATGAKRRTLRFLLSELHTPAAAASQTLDCALNEIAGSPLFVRIRTCTVSSRLQTTRTVVHKWLLRGELAGGKDKQGRQWVERASLVDFLKRRMYQ